MVGALRRILTGFAGVGAGSLLRGLLNDYWAGPNASVQTRPIRVVLQNYSRSPVAEID